MTDGSKQHARQAQASDTARVFVTTLGDTTTVVAIPAIVLARLAIDRSHQGAGLGRSLVQDALLRCSQAADSIGARVLPVHAKHDRAAAWHRQYGFAESPTDPLHLQLLMKDIRRFLNRSR